MKSANHIHSNCQHAKYQALVHPFGVQAFWLSVLMLVLFCYVLFWPSQSVAQQQEGVANTLLQLRHVNLPGDRLQIVLDFENPITEPASFSIDQPARLAFDFSGMQSALDVRTHAINVGLVQSVNALEAGNRTRVVVNLTRMMDYETHIDGNRLTILLTPRPGVAVSSIQPLIPDEPIPDEETAAPAVETHAEHDTSPPLASTLLTDPDRERSYRVIVRDPEPAPPSVVAQPAPPPMPVAPVVPAQETPVPAAPVATPVRSVAQRHIENVDFRRGEAGEGRVIIDLSDPATPVDLRERAGEVELIFARTALPERLQRRLDVTDFATPVTTIDTRRDADRVRITVALTGLYDLISWQMDGQYVLETRPLSDQERADLDRERFTYTGERLSLNFQDIEVRSVLQLLADFTDLNIVVSDSVSGNITLRLRNVPWDQALEIILKTKGLDKRESGNVIYVAPAAEIAARERQQLEALRQLQELEPVHSEFIRINYAIAEDIANIIRRASEGRTSELEGRLSRATGFISERGSLTVDARTNTLLVQETRQNLEEIRRLVAALDTPVQQVLIESRIIIASENFARELGTRFGVSGGRREGDTTYATSGSLGATNTILGGGIPSVGGGRGTDRLNVVLPASTADAGQIAFSILRPDVLLDLEIAASQVEGRSESLASPRVVTSNGQEALIRQGRRIPYESTDTDGQTQTEFVDALLEAKVTPNITPNQNLILTINVKNDEPDWANQVRGQPAIFTREVNTQVFLRNGETIVLGGVYETDSANETTKVPFLGDIPVMGALFRNRTFRSDKRELLIFVTPKIVDETNMN